MNSRYTHQELFDLVVLSTSREKANNLSKLITQSTEPFRGGYRVKSQSVEFIVIPDWVGNDSKYIGEECTAVWIEDESDIQVFKQVLEDLRDYHSLFVCSNGNLGKPFAEENKLRFVSYSDSKQVFKAALETYEETTIKIQTAFAKYDADRTGYLEIKEMRKLASELGAKVDSESYEKALKAMDANQDGKIDLDEFMNWWKIAKNKPHAVAKCYDLKSWIEKVSEGMFSEPIQKVTNGKPGVAMNNVDIDVITDAYEVFDFATRVEFRINAGEAMHTKAIRRYGSKFNDKLQFTEGNWFSIAVFTKPLTKTGAEIEHLMHELKDNLIAYAEKNWTSGVAEFIEEFVGFEVQSVENSAHISMVFKQEIAKIIKRSFTSIVSLLTFLTENNEGFNFEFILNSKENLGEAISKGVQARKMFEEAEINFESSGNKLALRKLINSLKKEFVDELQFLEILYAPDDFNVKLRGPITELQDEGTRKALDSSMKSLEPFLNFIKDIMPDEIEKVLGRLEFAVSLYDFFGNFEIYSSTLFQE